MLAPYRCQTRKRRIGNPSLAALQHELVEPLNDILKLWSIWNNLYGAQRRLLKKVRAPDGKVKRTHEKKASTPCTRLLNHPECTQSQRDATAKLKAKKQAKAS